MISAFYLSDLQGCSAHPGRSRPPQVLDFADGAKLSTLYIDYAGATPGVTRFDIQWYRDGRPYGMDSWHPGAAGSILAYCKEYAPIGAGNYRLDLRVDGSLIRSTTMHVRAPVEMDDPVGFGSMSLLGTIYRRIPVARLGALEVPVLYASDSRGGTYGEGGSVPPQVRAIAPHPAQIAIFYEYTNADPGATTVRLILHLPGGRTRTLGPRLLPVISGLQREQIGSDEGFASGHYRIELQGGWTHAGRGHLHRPHIATAVATARSGLELLHQPSHVRHGPVLGDLAALEAVDADGGQGHTPAGRGHPVEQAAVLASGE